MARINLGIVFLVLCLCMSLMSVISANACSETSQTTGAKLCRGLTGWAACILCLASCAVLIVGPFTSSVSM